MGKIAPKKGGIARTKAMRLFVRIGEAASVAANAGARKRCRGRAKFWSVDQAWRDAGDWFYKRRRSL
jgi:hypothetical protein